MIELKGFKFVTKLVSEFKRIQSDDKTVYRNFDDATLNRYINSTVKSNILKSLRQGSGWIIDSVIDHNINI